MEFRGILPAGNWFFREHHPFGRGSHLSRWRANLKGEWRKSAVFYRGPQRVLSPLPEAGGIIFHVRLPEG